MNPILTLIKKAGGVVRIANESQETDHRVTEWAIYKWVEREKIPQEQWGLIMRLAHVSVEDIYRAHNPAPGEPVVESEPLKAG